MFWEAQATQWPDVGANSWVKVRVDGQPPTDTRASLQVVLTPAFQLPQLPWDEGQPPNSAHLDSGLESQRLSSTADTGY